MGCIPLSLSAQTPPPEWLLPAMREMEYPTDTYFSEFIEGNLRPNENVSALLNRLKSDARRGAAGSIRTLINSVVEKTDRQDTYGHDFRFTSVYQDYTQQTVQADIANIHTDSYYDADRKWGYAFAYVSKSELASYYRAQIDYQLLQMENDMLLSANMVNNEEKVKARKLCEDALQPLTKIEFAQNLLTAIYPGDTTGMQMSRYLQLKNKLLQTLIRLEQSTYIYLQCTETNLGNKVRVFEPVLKDSITNNQCSLTADPSEADYRITVTASTREHDGNAVFGDGVMKYSYADAEVEVYSNIKRKVIYSNVISMKNNRDGATYESAGRNALKLAAGKVWQEVMLFVLGK